MRCSLIYSMIYIPFSQKTYSISSSTSRTTTGYSSKPQDNGSTPLVINKGDSKTMLNEFFFYVFPKFPLGRA